MNIPTIGELTSLMESPQGPCVTIMFPTNRTGVERQAERLRLRHAAREAGQRLQESGLRAAEDLLDPVTALLENASFWQRPGDGLAIFRSPRLFRSYRVPFSLPERVVVSDHFFLKPLLPLLADEGRFYVLALSQNDVRLLEGTHYSIQAIALPATVPRSLAQALKYDDLEENDVRHHSSSSGALVGKGGRRAAVFHGQGVGIDQHKDQLLRYFQQVDRGLHALLEEETAPLLLAGVEYLLPIYREANTYAHLLDQEIAGNPDRLSAETLRKSAWTIVQPVFLQRQRQAAADYQDMLGTGLATSSIEDVLPAACYGRVANLFVALDHEQWGRYDPATGALTLHRQEEAGDADLLDVAATQTLLHGGHVYAVDQEEVPGRSPLAALFRY